MLISSLQKFIFHSKIHFHEITAKNSVKNSKFSNMRAGAIFRILFVIFRCREYFNFFCQKIRVRKIALAPIQRAEKYDCFALDVNFYIFMKS